MRKGFLLLCVFCFAALGMSYAQLPPIRISEERVQLSFNEGTDVLYPQDNKTEIEQLYHLIDEYRSEIISGRMPIYICGYSASLSTREENLDMAYDRASGIKTNLIKKKGLQEKHFIVTHYASSLNMEPDVVLVVMHVCPPDIFPM